MTYLVIFYLLFSLTRVIFITFSSDCFRRDFAQILIIGSDNFSNTLTDVILSAGIAMSISNCVFFFF